MVWGAFHLLLMAALAIGMAAIECWLIMGFFQRRTVRSIGDAT
jgi:hypothetical protein